MDAARAGRAAGIRPGTVHAFTGSGPDAVTPAHRGATGAARSEYPTPLATHPHN
ncbi:hypothetical protein ACIBAI_27360 [Streptomyces sp. NPDC051041]|uniref:hypothetical protein n=1 Tax=Streptomyces sp. NPDC051041 TaxID=3365640 RepID=UPI0037B696E6